MNIYIPPIVLWLSVVPIIFLVWFIAFCLISTIANCDWFRHILSEHRIIRNCVEATMIAFLILLPALTVIVLGLAYQKLGLF